jgi:hypothetical protein
MVFIIDSIVGDDDGGVEIDDFKKIGINCLEIQPGQGILCWGIYGKEHTGSYKIVNNEQLGRYTLNGFAEDVSFSLTLSTAEKCTSIIVNNEEYRLDYINSNVGENVPFILNRRKDFVSQ